MGNLKIKKEYPPNYEKISSFFDIQDENVVFAYGDTIYAPKGGDIAEHLIVHESIHAEQQSKFSSPEEWWDKYLTDDQFRLEQEIQAYASQYTYVKRLYTEKVYSVFLDEISKHLSSKIYGNIIDFNKAKTAIRKFAQLMV